MLSSTQKAERSLLLLLAATIWGTAFVAQARGMEHIGPFAFTWARSMIGAAFLFVLLPLIDRVRPAADRVPHPWQGKKLWQGGFICGTLLFVAESLQQFGILSTPVGKAGFITSLTIILVPLAGIFVGRKSGANVWVAVAFSLVGLYLLCMHGELAVNPGDLLVLGCAIVFTGHILVIDRFAPLVDCVRMSCIQFFVGGCWGGIAMVLFELPDWEGLMGALPYFLYAGMLSNGVAYTLQIVGQKGMNPTVATLIMALESVISVLSGWLFLDQILTYRELTGCALMALAIVIATVPLSSARRLLQRLGV